MITDVLAEFGHRRGSHFQPICFPVINNLSLISSCYEARQQVDHAHDFNPFALTLLLRERGGGGRKGGRRRDRQTDRQTETETERDRDRARETDRQRQRDRDREREREGGGR